MKDSDKPKQDNEHLRGMFQDALHVANQTLPKGDKLILPKGLQKPKK